MKTKISLILIILLGAILRLYNVGQLPALNADEAALGYNAYSLLQTGKDEFGTPWPLLFRSFDDYKPGIYVYLLLPFIKFMGLTVWATRLPAVLISITSIAVIYLLTKAILGKNIPNRKTIALLSALMLAINPWHIHFSRGAWETQVASTFLLLGIYLLIVGLRKPAKQLSGIFLVVLSLYTYHSMRVIVPLLALSYFIIYYKQHFNKLKSSLVSLIFGIILLIPFGFQLLSPQGVSRAQGVSIFADTGPLWRVNELRSYHPLPSALWVKVLYNKLVAYALDFTQNYLSHFDGNFLFVTGDTIQRNKVPHFGQLLLITIPFLYLGIYSLTRSHLRHKKILLAWLLIAPIPAALTFQSPHAVRAFSMTIPISIIIALGINYSITLLNDRFNSKKSQSIIRKSYITCLIVLFLWDISRYLFNYHRLMVPTYPFSSQYGLSELIPWAQLQADNYDHIWITDRYDQPYILFLFYSKYPPQRFQAQAQLSSRDKFGFATVRNIDHYHFESIDIPTIQSRYPDQKILLIGTDEEIPNERILKEITLPRGGIIFQATNLE